MRHAKIERWNRMDSVLHRRHAIAKILAALALLFCVGTQPLGWAFLLYAAVLVGAVLACHLPLRAMLSTAAAVLPFALCFAAISALSGERDRALLLLIRASLSALTALLLIATTPLPRLLSGLGALGAPRFLLQVMQFLYRYLMVLTAEAAIMSQARACRAGAARGLEFSQAASAAGVLFSRAYGRANAIHRAMVSRGFEGVLPASSSVPFQLKDGWFVGGSLLVFAGLRLGLR